MCLGMGVECCVQVGMWKCVSRNGYGIVYLGISKFNCFCYFKLLKYKAEMNISLVFS